MTVNRSIFAFIKSPTTLFFSGGFIVALAGCIFYVLYTTPVKWQCTIENSFYDIRKDSDVTLTRGVYHTYREGLNTGHITFIGSIKRFNKNEMTSPPIPVHRESSFTATPYHNLIQMKVTGHGRRLGDQSSDKDVQNYVLPQITPGGIYTTALYLFNGKTLGSGTESVPRSVCNN